MAGSTSPESRISCSAGTVFSREGLLQTGGIASLLPLSLPGQRTPKKAQGRLLKATRTRGSPPGAKKRGPRSSDKGGLLCTSKSLLWQKSLRRREVCARGDQVRSTQVGPSPGAPGCPHASIWRSSQPSGCLSLLHICRAGKCCHPHCRKGVYLLSKRSGAEL